MSAGGDYQVYLRSTLKAMMPPPAIEVEGEEWLSNAQCVVTPNGRLHLAATAFLLSLARRNKSEHTLKQYGRMLTDFLCVLEEANGGRGIQLSAVDDAILERWKISQIHHRRIRHDVFRTRLNLVLRFLVYSQTNGWIAPIVGDDPASQIHVKWDGAKLCHDLQEGHARKAAVVSVPKDDFLVIDAEIELSGKKAITRRTRFLLSRLMRIAAFRRSEVLRLTVDDIPSMSALRMRRVRVAQGTAEPIIRFMIVSSKNGGSREVSIPLSLALEIRSFIETERAALLDRKGIAAKSQRAVFLSQKTGKVLTPQAITNYWKVAANKAARRLRRPELAAHRPHFSRHRGITDHAEECLKAGISPAETMYKILKFARIARLSTAHTYVHLAQDELKPRILPTESNVQTREAEVEELRMMERQF